MDFATGITIGAFALILGTISGAAVGIHYALLSIGSALKGIHDELRKQNQP